MAAAAIAGSGRPAADLPCVFVSAHGDLSINDYACSTLATDPSVLSPTRFHNSVHNAAGGLLDHRHRPHGREQFDLGLRR